MAAGPRFSWAHLGLVAAGGAAGTAIRAAVLLLVPDAVPGLAVAVINVVGAFVLAVLTASLARRADTARARAAHQLFGTGLLGGFTTYSTFALDAVAGTSLLLTVGTVIAGVLAALAGFALFRQPGVRGDA